MRPVRSEHRDPLTAPDGSTVRELLGPPTATARNQSLAEATVAAGACTVEHFHRESEEIYVFLSGSGEMTLAGETFSVAAGDSVAIAPSATHSLENRGAEPLVLLCCCSPPYSDEDTVLTGPTPA